MQVYGQLISAQLELLASDPANILGRVWFNKTTGLAKFYDGSAVRTVVDRDYLATVSLANPMNTAGDIMYGGVAGAVTRLGAGSADQVLITGSTPSWGKIADANVSSSAAIALSKLAAGTFDTVPYFDGTGHLVSSAVTPTQLGFLSGASSNLQTQISANATAVASKADSAAVTIALAAKQDASTAVTLTGAQTVSDKTLTAVAGITLAASAPINWAAGNVSIGASIGINTMTIGGAGTTAYVPGILKGGIVVLDGDTFFMNNDAAQSGVDWKLSLARPATGMTANAVVTLPTATTTLVGRDTTDTLTFKTLMAATFGSEAIFASIATPTTPAAGYYKLYPKSDGKFYFLNPAGVETAVGSGSGSGGINYIDNGDFETTANGATPAGWVAYADAAAATPVDGTGGSPNAAVTFAASTSSPIRGLSSAVFTKDAANRQGTGWAIPFTIASPDKSKKCQLKVELDASTNYVAGDLAFYIYDVTNSVLITPSTAAIPKLTNGSWLITFDSTTSTSYRLIMHIATVSALAYTVKVDTFVVNAESMGSTQRGGDWNSNITFPVPTGLGTGSGTMSVVTQPSIDTIKAKIRFTKDASAGTGSSPVTFTMPTGYTIDLNKLTSIKYIGVASYSGVNFGSEQDVVALSSTTFVIRRTGSASNYLGSDMGANSEFNMYLEIPIAEWAGQSIAMGAGANVEYAANSNATSTATDSTSFINGTAGANIPNGAVGTAYNRTVQFSTPNQPTHQFKLEASTDGLNWLDFDQRFGARVAQGTNNYGALVIVNAGNTATVEFGIGGVQPNNAAYAGNSTTAWSAFTGFKWRLTRYNPSAPVGIQLASSTSSGLVSYEDSGSFAVTLTGGYSANPSGTMLYKRVGLQVSLYLATAITGTSNATTVVTFAAGTLPTSIRPTNGKIVPCCIVDNGSNFGGWALINSDGSANFYKDATFATNYTASGVKGLSTTANPTYTVG